MKKDNNIIKKEKGLVQLFKNVRHDMRLSKT